MYIIISLLIFIILFLCDMDVVDEAMETIGVNVQFDESDEEADNEDVYGEERIQDDEESEGESSEEETDEQRRAIQAAAVCIIA